jgi:Meiotically up-regulated gene 113
MEWQSSPSVIPAKAGNQLPFKRKTKYYCFMRERILSEIKRIAEANDGQSPGMGQFEDETGIRPNDWKGKIWARWGDAIREAGFQPQELAQKTKPEFVFLKLVEACREYKKFPTKTELQLFKQERADFPWYTTLLSNFADKATMQSAFYEWLSRQTEFGDVLAMLPEKINSDTKMVNLKEGHVYLLKSGAHYKIGRGDELEKRVKQIRTALPDASTLEHSIRTDDPSGIEAYWHRRFADKRANGEWFKLTLQDVTAFKKRKFQWQNKSLVWLVRSSPTMESIGSMSTYPHPTLHHRP